LLSHANTLNNLNLLTWCNTKKTAKYCNIWILYHVLWENKRLFCRNYWQWKKYM